MTRYSDKINQELKLNVKKNNNNNDIHIFFQKENQNKSNEVYSVR